MLLQTEVKNCCLPFERFEENAFFCGIGSCFAVELFEYLRSVGLATTVNPTGIVYNLISMAAPLRRLVEQKFYTEGDFFKFNEQWHSWEHHGDFSKQSLEISVSSANHALSEFASALMNSSALVLTPSSSVVYVHKVTGKVVANCHRVPGNEFERRLLTHVENFAALNAIINDIMSLNPLCKIILTLSPVRHYRGDLILNSRSKAHLVTAIHSCVERYPEKCAYFPAYEIMNDELRDYRFYKEDMLHPSDLAVKIIIKRFINAIFTESAVINVNSGIKLASTGKHIPRKHKILP